MPTDATLLAGVPLFQALADEDRVALAATVDVVRLPAGETVFEYGSPGNALYVIRAGAVEVFITDDTGARIVLETGQAGDFFGEISLLDNGPRTATVIVTQDLEALRIDRDALHHFLRRHPAAALDLLTVVGRRLRESSLRLRHTASRNVNEELADTRSVVQKAIDRVAAFSGSIAFLVINATLFTFWIVTNVGILPHVPVFDRYPFELLTMAIAMEAILLSILVLVSQNRQAAKDHIRADIEYAVNLKAELEIAHLHEKVDHLNTILQARLDGIERAIAGNAGT